MEPDPGVDPLIECLVCGRPTDLAVLCCICDPDYGHDFDPPGTPADVGASGTQP